MSISGLLKGLAAVLGTAAAGAAIASLVHHGPTIPKKPAPPVSLPAPAPAPAPSPAPAPAPTPPPAPSPSPSALDAAKVLSFTIPSQMVAGSPGTFTVVVRNDGTATWDDNYRLGVVGDFQGDGSRFQENVGSYPDVGRVHLPQGTTVPPGQSWAFTVPVVAPLANRTYDVKLRMVHELVQWFGDTAEQLVAVTGPPPVTFPTYEAMRRFRGDLAGIKIPEIKPYGATDVFFTAVYPAYPASVRATIRQVYKQHGYTHLPLSLRLGDYHGLYPQYDFINKGDVAGFRSIVSELWSDGLIPVVFVVDDQEPAQTQADMDAIKAKYTPFLMQVHDLVFVTCLGWEINGWASPLVMTQGAQWLKQTLPDALVYMHFTAGHAAGSDPSQSESDWWRSMQNVLQGILYQHDGTQGGQAVSDRLADFTLRFQTGYNGWPQGFDTVAFEYSAYWQVNQGGPYDEAWGDQIGDAAMGKTSPAIQGYCDGGSLPVGGALPPCPWLPAKLAPSPTAGAPPTAPAPAPPVPAPAPAPPPPPPSAVPADAIDLTQAVIHNSPADVASWPATAKVTRLEAGSSGFQIDFTKRDGPMSWPDYTPPGWAGPIEYTLWIVIQVNGQWHASGCIQIWRDPNMTLWSGGPPSGVAANWYYDANRWGVMTGHQPAVGEMVGFFVTAGNARNNGDTLVKERSNVVLVPFPADTGGKFTW